MFQDQNFEENKNIDELLSENDINNMGLKFILPGYDNIELLQNGINKDVNLQNLREYVDLIYEYYVIKSTQVQVQAFRNGFSKILSLESLNSFECDEINELFCGKQVNQKWEIFELIEYIIPSHGYSQKSQQYLDFLQVICEFDSNQQKDFLQFVTGCPRLPFGGLKNLQPSIQIVKKTISEKDQSPDDILPSVMTCQNYIKLPEYSNVDIMRKRILFAIKEGQNNFTLS